MVCSGCGGMTPRINPLNAELNPICCLLALLGAHHIFHVSRIKVNKHQNLVVLTVTIYVVIGQYGGYKHKRTKHMLL
jgi:hypothetical protein